MSRNTILAVCLLLALLPATALADDPARHIPSRTELLCDPTDEARADARFGRAQIVRDKEKPGSPIVEVYGSRLPDQDDDVSILVRLPHLRSLKTYNLARESR